MPAQACACQVVGAGDWGAGLVLTVAFASWGASSASAFPITWVIKVRIKNTALMASEKPANFASVTPVNQSRKLVRQAASKIVGIFFIIGHSRCIVTLTICIAEKLPLLRYVRSTRIVKNHTKIGVLFSPARG
jgi:hypothetical protein